MFQSFWGGAWRPGFSHAGLVAPTWRGEGPGLRREGPGNQSVVCFWFAERPEASLLLGGPQFCPLLEVWLQSSPRGSEVWEPRSPGDEGPSRLGEGSLY